MKTNKINIVGGLLCLLAVSSCKLPKASIEPPKSLTLPATFLVESDSSKRTPMVVGKSFFTEPVLKALIDTAVVNAFDIQDALARVEMARAGVRLNTGLDKPTVDGLLSFGQRRFGDFTIDGVGNYDTKFSTNLSDRQRIPTPIVPDLLIGLQSSWEIDLWGKLKNQKKSAIEKLLVSEEYKNLVTTQLVSDIASAYYELIVKDNELIFLDENIALQSRGLGIIEVLKQSGQANQLAIDLFKGQLLASQTIKKSVELEIMLLENKINLLVGRFPQKINRPIIELNQLNLPKFNAGIPSSMLLNRPDLRMAERELLISKADLEVARLAFYPNLNLTAGLGLQAFRPSVILNPGSLAANTFGSLLSPWINRRVLEAELMASKASQKMAYINYDKTVLTAFTEVNTSLNTIDNLTEQFGLKLEEVEVLRSSIQASNELYRSGRATYLEVVTAQKNALQSQIELTNVRKDQINAIINLYRSLGGGWQ